MAAKSVSLAYSHRTLSKEWLGERNGELSPRDVTSGSDRKVWWRCKVDPTHEWEASIYNRARLGAGCQMCAGRVATPSTSLRAMHPRIAEEWHAARNGQRTPDTVVPGSCRKVWWKCAADGSHEWQATPASRAKRGSRCPMCSGRIATPTTSLRALYPKLTREWDRARNRDLNPGKLRPGSPRKVWWVCAKDKAHRWQASINNRAMSGKGCPICAGQVVIRKTSLKARHRKIAAEWHESKNGDMRPDEIAPASNRYAWWRCAKNPNHEWRTKIAARTVGGTGCPVCAGRVVSPETSLLALYPDIAAQWHEKKNGKLTPADVMPHSGKRAWWRCSEDPEHVWDAAISTRTLTPGCPICSGRRLSLKTSLHTVNRTLARQWHPTRNAGLTPRDVLPFSRRRAWWRCPKDKTHAWQTTVGQRSKGQGCPVCLGRVATKED